MLGLCKFSAAQCVYTHDKSQLPRGPWDDPDWAARNRNMIGPSGAEHNAQMLERLAPLLKPTQPLSRESLLPTARAQELEDAGTAYISSFMQNVPAAMLPELGDIYRGAPGRVRRGEAGGTSFRGKGKRKANGKGEGKSGGSRGYNQYWAEPEDEDKLEERMANLGFTNDEFDELISQGVKPWDDDAWVRGCACTSGFLANFLHTGCFARVTILLI